MTPPDVFLRMARETTEESFGGSKIGRCIAVEGDAVTGAPLLDVRYVPNPNAPYLKNAVTMLSVAKHFLIEAGLECKECFGRGGELRLESLGFYDAENGSTPRFREISKHIPQLLLMRDGVVQGVAAGELDSLFPLQKPEVATPVDRPVPEGADRETTAYIILANSNAAVKHDHEVQRQTHERSPIVGFVKIDHEDAPWKKEGRRVIGRYIETDPRLFFEWHLW